MSAKYLTTVVSVVALTLAVGAGFANTRPAQAQGGAVHVRAVDLDAVIQKSSSAKAVLTDFQNFQKTKQAELQKEQATLEQAQRQLGPAATQEEMQAYGQRVQAISRKLQEAELEAQKRFASTQQKVLQSLAPTFQSYARETGVGMLVDSKTGGVLFVDPTWDVTQAVLGRVK
jgi:Skp family chaperone for outer membrane proteins